MSQATASRRLWAVDAARGFALALMVVYHAAWDADFLGLAPAGFFDGRGWDWFRAVILGTFLVLVGVSLVLAHGDGVRRRAFVRRLVLVVGGAALITGLSAIAFPAHLIFFGVLHCIALSSVLGLAFVRLPWLVPALAGIAIAALGILPISIAAFDAPALGWIGFMPAPPASRDYVPLVPWFGAVLLGIAGARLALRAGLLDARAAPSSRPPAPRHAVRALAFGGRNSLLVYLIHQPVLFAGLAGIALLAAGDGRAVPWRGAGSMGSAAFARSFTASCRRSCGRGGLPSGRCAAYCQCMLNSVRRRFTAAQMQPDTMRPETRARLRRLAARCLKRPDGR